MAVRGDSESGVSTTKAAVTPRVGKPVTFRAVAIGLLGCAAVTMWVHHAELILGGARGHTALANTSIPVGAFFFLVLLVAFNVALRKWWPRVAFAQGELITVYVMMTVSTVLASSGGIHFLIPTLAAAFYFATPANQWAEFHQWIPSWFAPRDIGVLDAFYTGGSPVPVHAWLTPFWVWGGFLLAFVVATLCLSSLLRRPWVEHERLTFPTVVLPLELTEPEGALLKNRLMWGGFFVAFAIGTINTLHLNFPAIPGIEVRQIDLSPLFPDAPWSAVGYFPISFYPFVIGIAYLLSLEVTFSYWVCYLLTKGELVAAAAAGFRLPSTSSATDLPYLGNQGAGAFLALAAISVWMSRRHLLHVLKAAVGVGRVEGEEREAMSSRMAVFGFVLSFGSVLYLCWAAGLNTWVALLMFGLIFCYLLAATRIRAESGSAWLFGSEVDPNSLVTESLGGSILRPVDLTVMAYLRAVSTYDLRCASMPHQVEALRMGGTAGVSLRQLTWAMVAGVIVAIAVAWWGGLYIWYSLGAATKTDWWRTEMGMTPFLNLRAQLTTPPRIDFSAASFDLVGFGVTCLLAVLRVRFLGFPLHPVGYAMANTDTWGQLPMPFFVAWLIKTLVLRYGGMRLYRKSLPFFLGLILGDMVNGGFYNLLAAGVNMRVYPVNW